MHCINLIIKQLKILHKFYFMSFFYSFGITNFQNAVVRDLYSDY